MTKLKRITHVFQSSEQIPFNDSAKIVLMSDCHRGDGSCIDKFSNNENIYLSALNSYYNENYTYIEIGDGDELWKSKDFSDIVQAHEEVFLILSKFYTEDRLYFIFGNHDNIKENKSFVESNLYEYFDKRQQKNIPLFKNIKIHEGLVLNHTASGNKIFLVHGHQADYLNDNMWRLSRFLVKFLWRSLELLGINDPRSASKKSRKKEAIKKRLTEWVIKNGHMLIAGHTHMAIFSEKNTPAYFNTGSCVYPRYVTAIEIADGNITLVKWSTKVKNDGTLFIGRDVLCGPRKIKDYFDRK